MYNLLSFSVSVKDKSKTFNHGQLKESVPWQLEQCTTIKNIDIVILGLNLAKISVYSQVMFIDFFQYFLC